MTVEAPLEAVMRLPPLVASIAAPVDEVMPVASPRIRHPVPRPAANDDPAVEGTTELVDCLALYSRRRSYSRHGRGGRGRAR